MNTTICVTGCTHEDRFFAGPVTTLEVHGTLHRVCGNCEGRLIEDHDAHVGEFHQHLDWTECAHHVDPDHGAHVDALYRHLDIQPSAYSSVDSFLYERDCLIEMRDSCPDYFADLTLYFPPV